MKTNFFSDIDLTGKYRDQLIVMKAKIHFTFEENGEMTCTLNGTN